MGGVAVTNTGPVVGETKLLAKANIRPLFFCAIAVWGAILYGYDGTYFAGILAMPRFLEDFGTLNAKGEYAISSADQSLLASIVQAGELVGSLAAGFIGQATGRKGAFLAASALVCLGTILQLILVGSIPLLTVGRFVLGSGVGIISNATPLYLSEVAPTAIRGAVVSSWQLFLAIGQVIGACVDQGTKSIDSTASYRIPIGLNFLIALIIVAGMLIIPESPRWLVSKHKDEQALASLRKINRDQPDPEAVVDVEFKSFIDSRKEEEELSGAGGWGEIFSIPIERRKLFLVWGILVGQQIGGVQFIFSYTTTFFKSIGLTDEFLVTIIVDVIEVFGVLCSFLLVNRIGRRPLLIYTSIPMFISLFVTGALGTIDARTETQNRTIAAMICIYVFFFNLAWGPLAWVVASELSAGRNKTRIMSVSTASFWLVAWAVTFTLPYLFDNAGLGPQIGWIYGVGTLIALAFVFFCIPETRGRSLEDITEMFEAKLPALKWITYETQNERARVANSHALVAGEDSSSDVDGSDDDGKVDNKKTVDSQNNKTVDA